MRCYKIARKLEKCWKQVILYDPPYVPKIIYSDLISHHDNDYLADHFKINKSSRLRAKNQYLSTFYCNIKTYIKNHNIYIFLNIVYHNFYDNLQDFLVSTDYWIYILLNFVATLLISANSKDNSYNSIFVMNYYFTKMIYYKLVKVTIDLTYLVEIIIYIMI